METARATKSRTRPQAPFPDTKGMIGDPAFHRSDIRENRAGVLLTVTLTIVDVGNGCAPIAGAQVQIWHCDAGGVYSEYANAMNAGSTTTTYLRGVQVTDAAGRVTFTTIYPGWYTPRATHVHVQIYNGTVLKKTTQLGFPDAVNATVYTPASLVTSLYMKGSESHDERRRPGVRQQRRLGNRRRRSRLPDRRHHRRPHQRLRRHDPGRHHRLLRRHLTKRKGPAHAASSAFPGHLLVARVPTGRTLQFWLSQPPHAQSSITAPSDVFPFFRFRDSLVLPPGLKR